MPATIAMGICNSRTL